MVPIVHLSILTFKRITQNMKKLDAIIIWLQIILCSSLVASVICVSALHPDGVGANSFENFLLKRVTIQSVLGEDKWSKKYPYNENPVTYYVKKINGLEKNIASFCTTSFPFSELANSVVTIFEHDIIKYNINSIPSIESNHKYIEKYLKNVIEFDNELSKMNIPFFYVQTPSKASIDYYDSKSNMENDALNIAERSYCFTTSLENSGIDTVYIARDYPYEISFDTSSHWLPVNGLQCAEIIAQKIENDYNLDTDLTAYDHNHLHDLLAEYPELKKIIDKSTNSEFVIPCPNYPTNYEFTYAENDSIRGSFEMTVYNDISDWNTESGPYHDIFRVSNSLIYHFHNNNVENKTKVLIIGDSFNWPVGSYLSLSCSDVDILHNASFTGSIVNYVASTKPDIVIIVYNDAEFYEMFSDEAYYLK